MRSVCAAWAIGGAALLAAVCPVAVVAVVVAGAYAMVAWAVCALMARL